MNDDHVNLNRNQTQPAETQFSKMLLCIALVAALAGLLFGYDVGIISGVLLAIKGTFLITPATAGILVAIVPLSALAASALSGKLSDRLGRRNSLLLTALLFLLGILGCSLSNNINMLMGARLLVGFAIGIGSFSAPLYISELSQEKYRGGLVTLNQLAIVSGILVAYLINWVFTESGAWRYMFAYGGIPALLLFILGCFLPESPRWLVLRGKINRAKMVLQRFYPQHHESDAVLNELQAIARLESKETPQKIHHDFRKVLWLGILVSFFTQAVGIIAIISYAPIILQSIGVQHATTAVLATVGIGVINLIFTLFAIVLLDRFGRRPLLLTGVSGIILSLAAMVISFSFPMGTHPILTWLAFFSMITFVAAQAIGTGPACWLIPSEIFPANMRGLGMSLSVACNWGTNVLVALLFPIMLDAWGGAASFALFLIIALSAWTYFYRYLPETKGVSLEHIEENLAAGKRTRYLGV